MISRKKQSILLSGKTEFQFEILFVDDIFNSIKLMDGIVQGKKLMVVIDPIIYELYNKQIDLLFKAIHCPYLIKPIQIDESEKEMDIVLDLVQEASDFGMRRDSIFIGFGGGITMDVVGVLASIYRRGIKYIRIPTTLLGAIDAGVGIKTGVNFKCKKSLLGTFYPPTYSIISTQFLSTLPLPQMRNGLFELLKATLVMDKSLTIKVEKNIHLFLNHEASQVTDEIIKETAFEMVRELNNNLFEHSYERILDFGHTFSGYIESSSNYQISHGEAVGMDIIISAHISSQRQWLPNSMLHRLLELFKKVGFTNMYKAQPAERFFAYLSELRNHRAGDLNMVLIKDFGHPVFTNECSIDEIQKALEFMKKNGIFR